ncbi:MAG TPA: NUDIX hydrolase [Candidatus Paceibacterota bacterium]
MIGANQIIFRTEPEGFVPRSEIVSCFAEHDGKILLLHRQDHKPQGNTWGVPAGKLEGGEDLSTAMLRELREETGIKLAESDLSYFDKVYVRYPNFDFIYHMFHTKLTNIPEVIINESEHKAYQLVSPEEAKVLPLILGEAECITLFYGDSGISFKVQGTT